MSQSILESRREKHSELLVNYMVKRKHYFIILMILIIFIEQDYIKPKQTYGNLTEK